MKANILQNKFIKRGLSLILILSIFILNIPVSALAAINEASEGAFHKIPLSGGTETATNAIALHDANPENIIVSDSDSTQDIFTNDLNNSDESYDPYDNNKQPVASQENVRGSIADYSSSSDFQFEIDYYYEAVTIIKYLGTAATLVIPEELNGCTVTSIGSNAFSGCTSLNRVVIPDSVTNIGTNAFKGCSELTSVTLSRNLKTLGYYAFSDTKIQSIEIPKSLESGGSWSAGAFQNLETLKEITFEEGTTKIADSLFMYCTGLEEIQLPETLTTIEEYAFSGCVNLKNLYLPDSVDTIEANAFSGCNSINQISFGVGLTSIGSYAFSGCTSLNRVVIPDSVTNIGTHAFKGCSELTSVTLSRNLKTLGYYAFSDTKIQSIEIPKSLESGGSWSAGAFQNLETLKEITFEEGTTKIADSLFMYCTGLEEIQLPETLTTIEEYAFSGCVNLKNLYLPDSVTQIGYRAFQNCTNLCSINYPLCLDSVEGGAIFEGCSSLINIVVPEGVTALPSNVFQRSTYLKTVSLPKTLTSIGNYAFANCAELRFVSITNSKCSIEADAFSGSPYISLICSANSAAILYAIEHQIPFQETGLSDDNTIVIDRTNSDYYADLNAMTINGYVTMTVNFALKADIVEEVHENTVKILLPDNTILDEQSLKVNGTLCVNYDYDGARILTIPVNDVKGSIKFAIKISAWQNLQSYAAFVYNRGGIKEQELIDYINEPISGLTLSVPSVISDNVIEVSGLAPASSEVCIYLDGVELQRVSSSKAGNWKSSLIIQDIQEYKSYTISVSCQNESTTLTQASETTYLPNNAALTSFKMYYNEHQIIKSCDLLYEGNLKPKVYFLPGTQFDFEIKFDKPEQIDTLYVTSTRNNITKYLEATYDESKEAFVTNGYFDTDNPDYVPGTLNIEYTRKVEEVLVSDQYDWSKFDEITSLGSDQVVQILEKSDTDSTVRVDMSSILKDLEGLYIDTKLSIYDAETDGDLSAWLGAFKDVDTLASYIVPGYNGEKYLVALDYSDPYTYAMLVQDLSGSKFLKLSLDAAMDVNQDLEQIWTLSKISTSLETLNSAASMILKQHNIENNMDALREEVWRTNYATSAERQEALNLVDELEENESAFYLMATLLPLIVTAAPALGATMTIAPVCFTAILGVFTSIAPLFWNYRIAQIKGVPCYVTFVIDPSGYVYDIDSLKRISDVKTTAYYIPFDGSSDFWANVPEASITGTVWNAQEYNQENPIYTNTDGKYAWDVPEGWWRVKYEKAGYETVWSEWLPVPPPQTEVNIGMKALASSVCEFSLIDYTSTSGQISVFNNSRSSINGNFAVAAYNSDGCLVDVQMVQDTLTENETLILNVSCSSDEKIDVIKGFVLDVGTYKPLYKQWEVKINLDS